MPEYLYKDVNGHMTSTFHRMLYTTGVMCTVCDERMWRVPQTVMVTWGGLAPSQGELDPQIQGLIDTKDERRAAFDKEHEEHEGRTELENG